MSHSIMMQDEGSLSTRKSSLPSYLIRKMYTPPIKGMIFPTKNPFYNGKIVDYAKREEDDNHNNVSGKP